MAPPTSSPAITPEPSSPESCLLATVVEAMKEDPALEAVKIDRATHKVSLATLGRPRSDDLEAAVAARLQDLGQDFSAERCKLLDGHPSCAECDHGVDPKGQPWITIQQDPHEVTIARVTCPTAPRFWRWKDLPRPTIAPRERPLVGEEDYDREWKPQMAAAILCGAATLTGYVFGNTISSPIAFAVAFLSGSWFTAQEIWERLQERVLDVHFLMLAVACGSAAIGAWGEGAVLLFLFSFSGALEHYALGRTQREIRALLKSSPKTATVIDPSGQEHQEPVESLIRGNRLRVRPGELFPVDGEILGGETAVDESTLTGESMPVDKKTGDDVLAGTLNLWGVVDLRVARAAQQSALNRIIQLIQQAQKFKAPAQRLTDRFGTPYTYAILGLCLGMFFYWWLVQKAPPFTSTHEIRSAFYRAMTLLVVASPCALVLSIPSAILAAIAWGARHAVLFRGGAAVEKLAEINVAALDKTGTLTTGELQIEAIHSDPPQQEAMALQLAHSLEHLSTHPLARAINRFARHRGIPLLALTDFQSIAGSGLKARHHQQTVWLGRAAWVHQESGTHAALPTHNDPSHSEVWLATSGLLARILLKDDVRPQSRQVLSRLRQHGIRTVLLTGDRSAVAQKLQPELGLDEIRAELRPEDKVRVIQQLAAGGRRVAMVGDGVNDAPSLAAADVGVAMGARGSDAALEQADIVLMHDRLENFLTAFELSRHARRIIRQNLLVSLGTVVVLVACALFASIPLSLGVVGHEGSTVIVVTNSLRLLFFRPQTGPASPSPSAA